MSKIKIIIIILIILLIGIAGFLSYMGIFYTPVPSEKMTGPYTFVYEEFIGDYKKTGPVFDKVYKSLQDEGIKTTRALGIYFYNPAETPEDKLRSHCGIIIEENDLNKVPKLKSKYKVGHIGQHDSVVVEFPIKNSLSYMIGPMKCYPVIVKHAKEKGYKMTTAFELYDQPAERILYIMKIIK